MKLPSFLFKNLKNHSTSLGNNLAFPNEQDVPFDYKVIKKRFHKIINSLDNIGLKDISNVSEVQNYLSSLLNKCRELEEPIKKQLENICEEIIQDVLDVPLDTVHLNCQLVNKIEPNKSMRLLPEDADNRNFDFEDVNEIGNVNKVILKRRFINSLVLGAAHKYGTWYSLYADKLMNLNKDLLPLYEQIVNINDYLLFVKKEKISDKKPMQGALVEVNLAKSGEKTEINVQGLNFILLLIETFRGFFELFASHGLPTDNEKANYIIRQSDFLLAEPWDMRFGRELWDMIDNNIENTEYVPYFFKNICELPVDEFNDVIQEILAHTKKGKMYYEKYLENAQTEYEENKQYNNTNFDTQSINQDDIITDAYFTADELGADENVLNEDSYDKNNQDLAEILIQTPYNNITFNAEEMEIPTVGTTNKHYYVLNVICDDVQIPTELVYFRAETVNIKGKTFYQLHIHVAEELRRKGISFKLYQTFIEKCGDVVSLYHNRSASCYKDNNVATDNDEAINNLWNKLNTLPNIVVKKLKRGDKVVGDVAYYQN